MDKKHKGLVDNQDGDFILNESGTSVYIDHEELESTKGNSEDEEKPKAKPGETQNSSEE